MTAEAAEPQDGKGRDDVAPRTGDNARSTWRWSLHTIREANKHCSPDRLQALVDAFLWCTNPTHSVRFEDFARRVGYDTNTLYKVFSGKYRLPDGAQLDVPEKLVRAIRTFLDLEKERAQGGKNEFVLTPTAKRIWMACDLARESQTPVFLWGPSHIGKTWALENYAQSNNHGRTIYVRMKAASGLGGMVRKIATSLGISDKSNTANLLDYIQRALTSDMVLLLDEVHELQFTYRVQSFFACMEVLRELYDLSNCGMVLCGTNLLLERLQAGQHKEMEQLMRRGVHRFPLPAAPTRADLVAILEHWGLAFPDRGQKVTVRRVEEEPYEMLRLLAKRDGLKAITERLRYARKIAGRRGAKLAWEHVVEAHLIITAASQEAGNDWD